MERFAVVMAGGAGLRLWPLSREEKPKQFIFAGGDKSMLKETIERLSRAIRPENCFVSTNKKLVDLTHGEVAGLIPPENIIVEPLRKNTAACIAYAAMYIRKKYGSGLLCCVPADGYVKDQDGYQEAIELGLWTAEQLKSLVIVGISPTYPATGYGYMHTDKDKKVSRVYKFIEKPDQAEAQKMLLSGEYLWNGGIVLGDMDVIIANVEQHLPGHFEKISRALRLLGKPDFEAATEAAYADMEDISFDIGVLEKSGLIYAVKGFFDWDDIGSLDALAQTHDSDENGNFVSGVFYGMDTSGCVIYGDSGTLTATIGMQNVMVVSTKDAVLVAPRDRAQEVKKLVEQLKKNGMDKYV